PFLKSSFWKSMTAHSHASTRRRMARRSSTPALYAALPVTKVWRDAEVLPQSGVIEVSPESRSKRSIGAPSASAQIWVTIVFDPCPISTAPWYNAIRPPRFNPIRTVEGLGREVFPHPYHIPATPTPPLSAPVALELSSAASRRAAFHFG